MQPTLHRETAAFFTASLPSPVTTGEMELILGKRREKVFGDGRPMPLDREAKARIKFLAKALKGRTAKGKHYGVITAKDVDVLDALLWGFHNARSGLCFPSYQAVAERAKCARSTVAEAIKRLEAAGILTWVNRIVRIRVIGFDLMGRKVLRWRVIRTSNGYRFFDPKASKTDLRSGTQNQELSDTYQPTEQKPLDPKSPLDAALMKLGGAVEGKIAHEGAAVIT